MLASTLTVIVDEAPFMVGSKRGVHLAADLERLERSPAGLSLRVGLSATQKPVEDLARFLVCHRCARDGASDCTIIDPGHGGASANLQVEIPAAPLEADVRRSLDSSV